jgi:aryl-alcohol dehydrogenase-like predicted oxidoreductase
MAAGKVRTMETRRLGRLGHMSSVLIYGGAALSNASQEHADRSIQTALDAGINHFDTAADYGDSELRIGPWMSRIRDRIFLATKTGDRNGTAAYQSILRSLERLRVDHVDLIQLHSVGSFEELQSVTQRSGAVEGAVRARDEGLVRGIGITGHGMQAPAVHLEALRGFAFDTVLLPYNFHLARDSSYRRVFDALAEEARGQDVGLMAIKSIARNLWKEAEKPRFTTWYEPLDEQPTIDAAVEFALRLPEISGLCTAGEIRLLPMMIEAERRRGSLAVDVAEARLEAVPDLGSPFERAPGRVTPDWLEHLLPR